MTAQGSLGASLRRAFLPLLIVATLAAVSGCTHNRQGSSLTGDNPPQVSRQGEFTEGQLRAVVDNVFGHGTYARHATGQNVRHYSTYRAVDYVSVWQYVNARTPRWSYGWLCVQFAQAMRMEMQRAAALSGNEDSPAAIGWAIVRQVHPWGGVPAGGRHAVNVYVSGPGGEMKVWVLEPQTGIRALVGSETDEGWRIYKDAYPNLPHVEPRGVFMEL